jgi:hypothetical protein
MVLVMLAGVVFFAATPAAAADAIVRGGKIWLRGAETISPNGRTGFELTTGGVFVVWHDLPRNIVWASNRGTGVRGTFQTDGNLVIYNSGGQAVWDSGTWQGPCPVIRTCTLHVQDDGNVVIYDPLNFPMWNTGTWRR